MVKNRLFAILGLAAFCMTASAQINQVNRLPEVDENPSLQVDYRDNKTGFWIAAEASFGYSCRLSNSNCGYAEVDAVGGYRFNDYLRLGVGVGARYYIANDKVRYNSTEWAFPIFFNVRGNFIPTNYRSVVPYYSLDIGGTIQDGFMLRPTVGLRVGRDRSAFLIGLGYMGQDLFSWCNSDEGKLKCRKFTSFISLKLGYEF